MRYKLLYDPDFKVYVIIVEDKERYGGCITRVLTEKQVRMIQEAEANAGNKFQVTSEA